ncbi:hypothetical protein [Salinimonas iocasae]|uniref:Uncharacterized protein n=1 Tax=Salinimonas iocasae TaxID=2572577 RepID=A0A5B7YIW4_9ALTE|nr:hypothetical protein [Salinimonas iocasae]QCZ95504.1 hypothetical protein FBQ74_18460 [Salinimonas iocasae]
MDYSAALQVLHSIARALPGLYSAVVVFSAITGLIVTSKGVTLLIQSNKAQQSAPGSCYFMIFLGPLMLSLGTVLNVASYTLFRRSTNPVILQSYSPYASNDDFRVGLYAITTYITFFAWVLVAKAIYVGATGAHNRREKWVSEALVLWGLAGCCVAFPYFVDALSMTLGQGRYGTEYLTF